MLTGRPVTITTLTQKVYLISSLVCRSLPNQRIEGGVQQSMSQIID